MSTVFQVLADDSFDTADTGSLFTSASFEGAGAHVFLTQSAEYSYTEVHASGAWNGVGASLDIVNMSFTGSLLFLEGWSIGNSQNIVSEAPLADHDDDNVISNELPSTLEAANIIPWNPFPPLPIFVPPITAKRDESRYRKVSSFTRVQPVRIRTFR